MDEITLLNRRNRSLMERISHLEKENKHLKEKLSIIEHQIVTLLQNVRGVHPKENFKRENPRVEHRAPIVHRRPISPEFKVTNNNPALSEFEMEWNNIENVVNAQKNKRSPQYSPERTVKKSRPTRKEDLREIFDASKSQPRPHERFTHSNNKTNSRYSRSNSREWRTDRRRTEDVKKNYDKTKTVHENHKSLPDNNNIKINDFELSPRNLRSKSRDCRADRRHTEDNIIKRVHDNLESPISISASKISDEKFPVHPRESESMSVSTSHVLESEKLPALKTNLSEIPTSSESFPKITDDKIEKPPSPRDPPEIESGSSLEPGEVREETEDVPIKAPSRKRSKVSYFGDSDSDSGTEVAIKENPKPENVENTIVQNDKAVVEIKTAQKLPKYRIPKKSVPLSSETPNVGKTAEDKIVDSEKVPLESSKVENIPKADDKMITIEKVLSESSKIKDISNADGKIINSEKVPPESLKVENIPKVADKMITSEKVPSEISEIKNISKPVDRIINSEKIPSENSTINNLSEADDKTIDREKVPLETASTPPINVTVRNKTKIFPTGIFKNINNVMHTETPISMQNSRIEKNHITTEATNVWRNSVNNYYDYNSTPRTNRDLGEENKLNILRETLMSPFTKREKTNTTRTAFAPTLYMQRMKQKVERMNAEESSILSSLKTSVSFMPESNNFIGKTDEKKKQDTKVEESGSNRRVSENFKHLKKDKSSENSHQPRKSEDKAIIENMKQDLRFRLENNDQNKSAKNSSVSEKIKLENKTNPTVPENKAVLDEKNLGSYENKTISENTTPSMNPTIPASTENKISSENKTTSDKCKIISNENKTVPKNTKHAERKMLHDKKKSFSNENKAVAENIKHTESEKSLAIPITLENKTVLDEKSCISNENKTSVANPTIPESKTILDENKFVPGENKAISEIKTLEINSIIPENKIDSEKIKALENVKHTEYKKLHSEITNPIKIAENKTFLDEMKSVSVENKIIPENIKHIENKTENNTASGKSKIIFSEETTASLTVPTISENVISSVNSKAPENDTISDIINNSEDANKKIKPKKKLTKKSVKPKNVKTPKKRVRKSKSLSLNTKKGSDAVDSKKVTTGEEIDFNLNTINDQKVNKLDAREFVEEFPNVENEVGIPYIPPEPEKPLVAPPPAFTFRIRRGRKIKQ